MGGRTCGACGSKLILTSLSKENTVPSWPKLDFPVFDADNHLYETKDSFTRYLPDRYKGAVEYVELNGRTKIMIRGPVSDYIPNPTFDVVARPGAQEEYFRNGNPEGKSYREIIGEPMRASPPSGSRRLGSS